MKNTPTATASLSSQTNGMVASTLIIPGLLLINLIRILFRI